MAFTTVPTITDTVATAANLNTYIRDNQRALKDPPSQNYEANQGGDYTVTTSSWANVDNSNFALSIATTGGDVMIGFSGSIKGAQVIIDVEMDGTRLVNQSNSGILVTDVSGGNARSFSFVRLIQSVSANTHIFKLQWRLVAGPSLCTLYAGAGTGGYDVHPQFWARELT